MSTRVRVGALAAALVLLAGAAGCSDSGDKSDRGSAPARADGGGPADGRQPAWKRCEAPVKAHGSEAQRPGDRWQCASLPVPLDHGDPSRGTVDIALVRAKAKGPGKRIGSLLFNFGGPGGSGVAGLPLSAAQFSTLNSQYDLVSFDPRGVADSSAVVCRDSERTEEAHRIDQTPDTAAEESTYLATARAFGAGCAERSGRILPHVGTENAARDMDLIRGALGDEKLHYLGFSYGTELGAVYAHLFPARVGRLVLDGVVDPTADFVGGARNQVMGFQRALENYFEDRGIGAKEGTEQVVRLLERVDRSPLPTDSGRTLTEGLALTGIILPLYSEDSWPQLTKALKAAEDGDGTDLLTLADAYNNRDSEGEYSPQDHAQRAISCADSKGRVTAKEVRDRHLADFTGVSPVFGPYLAWDLAGWCADWPVPGTWDAPDVSAKGAAPILVVGTTGDSATPYEGARRMADELGEGVGVLLTNEGDTHGAYGTSECTTEVIDDYLLKGAIPEDGRTCSA
ncbi:alpha/beta hydrolase [Streptomyces yaizuensis]|uniref:Alpha/beta hydrolase n=1 Tax=Streptomyces yaizuensis TaxID=2989713 RepID=A0ABQ5NWF0_9ACTN|nr:alpha/beta hydrolase [Streptomyces sp. YSPA8]GLF94520.1 alpha/beta hydrolase [Streptomyces sp. YSPA8]